MKTSTFEIRGRDGKPVTQADVDVLAKWAMKDLRLWNGTVVVEVPKLHPKDNTESPIRALQVLCNILGLEGVHA